MTLVHPTFWPATGDGFEPVTDPSPGISVYIDGVLKTPGIDYTLGAGTGLVALGAAPVVASTLSWTGNFYKRVRFETEEYDFERIVAQLWELGTLDLISVI